MIVTVLLSGDQEIVHEKDGLTDNEAFTDALFIDSLKEMTIVVLRGISCPAGEAEMMTGMMNVLKFQEKSLASGALSSVNAPVPTVTVYVVFWDRLADGKIVIVLLSGDQEVVQEKGGVIDKEAFTEVLFIEALNEMMIVVLRGISCPVGE